MDESRFPTVRKFPNGGKIVRDETDPGLTRYFYVIDDERVQSFSGIREARIYADLRTVVGEFDETGAGYFDVPAQVAQHSQEAAKAYLRATVGLSCDVPPGEAVSAAEAMNEEAEAIRE